MKIGAIVWGVKDVKKSARFWKEALNYEYAVEPEDDWARLVPKDGNGITFSLNRVTSDKARRHHMDLYSTHFEEDLERLLALGATKADWNYQGGENFVVLKDPEGNSFCLVSLNS